MGMNVTREPYFQHPDAEVESVHWHRYLDGLRADGFRVASNGPTDSESTQWSVVGPNEADVPGPNAQDTTQQEAGDQAGHP